MNDDIFSAALSGLIHDSGKILQRANPNPTKKHVSMVDEPITVHATWTNAFVDQINPEVRKYARPGVYHHQPNNADVVDNKTVLRVAIADKLSASERHSRDGQDSGDLPQHMISVFDHVNLGDPAQHQQLNHYLPLKPISLDSQSIFPQEPTADTQQAYKALAEGLTKAAQQTFKDREIYLENLLAAFQKYTWSIPSAYYYDLPDISLYDHARSTAALATCLTDFDLPALKQMHQALLQSFHHQDSHNPVLNQSVALLIGGDISGIQDFIYTITAKEAARTLRGRSFYLQLLTEAVLRYLLRELQLPYTNVIYASGGHFFFFAPPSMAKTLHVTQKALTEKFIQFHGTALYLALGWVEVPIHGFAATSFPSFWAKMHQQLQIKKQQRYAELDEEALAKVFSPEPHGGNQEQLCAVCGREHPQVAIQKNSDEVADDIRICSLCQSFADQLGRKLPRIKGLHLGFSKPIKTEPHTALDVLAGFGMQVSFDDPQFHHPVDKRVTWQITDEPLDVSESALWLRYVVNEVPENMTFDQLQKRAQGISRLGVLRMDVDNLGKIFKEGLINHEGQSIGSLARLAMLSFQISLFFEGWIKQIIRQDFYQGLIYAVYAGGDDLFLVGPWHLMPRLALEICDELERFVSSNPSISISGGIAFIHGKYPIHEAAADAGIAEAKSKSGGKDRFTFLDVTSPWSRFKEMYSKQAQLTQIIENEGSHNLLQQLQHLGRMESAAQVDAQGKRVWGPWMWQMDYHLSQAIQRAKSETLKASLVELHQDIRRDMYDTNRLQDWGTAARWAQLLIRN